MIRLATTALLLVFTATLPCPQSAMALPAFLPDTDEGIFLTNALQSLSSFLDTEEGRALFAGDFAIPEFKKKADQTTFEIVHHKLLDRYGNPRCLLNFEGSTSIQVTHFGGCLERLKNGPGELKSNLLHEVLNMLLVELPSLDHGSIYSLSKKILSVDPAMIALQQEFVIHPTCEIWSLSWGAFVDDLLLDLRGASEYGAFSLARDQIRYLQAKGYRYRGDFRLRRLKAGTSAVHSADSSLREAAPLLLRLALNRKSKSWNWKGAARSPEIERPDTLDVSVRLPPREFSDTTAWDGSQNDHTLYSSESKIKLRIHFSRDGAGGTQYWSETRKPKTSVDQNLFQVPDCAAVPLLGESQ